MPNIRVNDISASEDRTTATRTKRVVGVKSTNASSDSSDSDVISDENWYRNFLSQKCCGRFVPENSDGQTTGESVCACGRKLDDHDGHVRDDWFNLADYQNNPDLQMLDPWKSEVDTFLQSTDAYGEVSLARIEGFAGHAQKRSKFARLSDSTNYETVYDLLIEKWRMPIPNLVLNILGGQRCGKDGGSIDQLFIEGILSAATGLDCNGWIFCHGEYSGVLDYAWNSLTKTGPSLIGITPWGRLLSKERLIDPEGKWPARYKVSSTPSEDEIVLDLNLTHCLLIDDGTEHRKTPSAQSFHNKFLDYLKARFEILEEDPNNVASDIPFVNILFGGSESDLVEVWSDADGENGYKTPTVIVKGSGGAADVLASALDGVQGSDLEKIIAQELSNEAKASCLEAVKHCLQCRDILSVFDKDKVTTSSTQTSSRRYALDTLILQSPTLISGHSLCRQLKLSLMWDKQDLARIILKDSDQRLDRIDFKEIALEALQKDRPGFIELLLLEDYEIGHILSRSALEDLYNKASEDLLVKKLLRKTKYNRTIDVLVEIIRKIFGIQDDDDRQFTLRDIGRVIRRLIGYFYEPVYLRRKVKKVCQFIDLSENDPKNVALRGFEKKNSFGDDEGNHFDEPARELFVWALLNDKEAVAEFFWTKQSSPIAAALKASNLLRSLALACKDKNKREWYKEQSYAYQMMALGVLTESYEANDEDIAWNKGSQTSLTEYLLIKKQRRFGGVTCLQLAFEGKCQEFIAHRSVQDLLDKIWRGKISMENTPWRIVFCIVFPPALYGLLQFREDEGNYKKKGISKSKSRISQKHISRSERGNLDVLDLGRNLNALERLRYFFTSPMIVFSYSCITFLIFLLLFSYVMLVEYYATGPGIPEMVLACWAATLHIEECRQMYKQGWVYFRHYSNWFDLSALIFFALAFAMRFFSETFEVSRYIMCVSLIVFYLRLLHIFSVFQSVGPMLIMIKKMTVDLVRFLFFIAVFFVAYGIVWTSILYPNLDFSPLLVYTVLRNSYWPMHGEVQTFLQGDLENGTCKMDNGILTNCTTAQLVAPPILAVYILFINVLMFNLLIALFSHRFQELHEENDIIWSFQRYSLIREYIDRPPMPPPLIILCHLPQLIHFFIKKLIRLCCCCVAGGKRRTPKCLIPILEFRWLWDRNVKVIFTQNERFKERDLSAFECLSAEIYMCKKMKEPPLPKHRGLKGMVESLAMEIRGQDTYDGLRDKLEALDAKFDRLQTNS